MHSCSASSGKPDSNSLDCIVFFLLCGVSTCLSYSLAQMSLWQPLYPYCLDIRYCRCSFSVHYICNLLFFELADAFQTACYVQLHLHLAFSITCRYLPSKIVHPQLVLSMPCRCLPQKLCIFNFRKSVIVDISTQYPLSSI